MRIFRGQFIPVKSLGHVSLFVFLLAGTVCADTQRSQPSPAVMNKDDAGLKSHITRQLSSIRIAAGDVAALVDAVTNEPAGSELLLEDGTYALNSTINITKDITIRALNDGNAVILDGQDAVQVFNITGGLVQLFGLSITRGVSFQGRTDSRTNDNNLAGGGMRIEGATVTVTVTSCNIYGNRAEQTNGGAIALDLATLTLTSCNISDNWSETNGGAIFTYRGRVTLESCNFFGNSNGGSEGSYPYWGNGAAVAIKASTLTATSCKFYENNAMGDGGAMWIRSGTVYLTSCDIYSNWVSKGNSGALHFNYDSSTTYITSCNIYENRATWGSRFGYDKWGAGGLGIGNSAKVHIVDSNIYNNRGQGVRCYNLYSGPVTIVRSHLYDNVGYDLFMQSGSICHLDSTLGRTSIQGERGGHEVQFETCPAPPAPPAPPATAAPTSSLLGDAHFFGPHGDRTDFKGRNNTYYNVLSTNNLSANVLFVHDTYNWRNKVVFGSWMKAVAVSSMTAENKVVKAAYHCERPAVMEVHFEGEAEPNGEVAMGADFTFQQVKVSLSKDFMFALSNGEWEVQAKNSYLPYKSQNMQKKRLDVNLKTISDVDVNLVAPHGLIGQAWDRDDKMVVGALDDYNTGDRFVETTANAEGAIEGAAVDYEIDPLDAFSTKFKYSRFGLKRAAPRDVSSLSGKKFPAKTSASAGAMNDEDDEQA